MPIRPENRDRYPADWKAISERVREEAGQKCEWCKAPNGQIICRGQGAQSETYMLARGETFCDKTGGFLGLSRGSEYVGRYVKVVLTVAHLDHQPENCARENLRALCQKCHNAYDAPMRRAGMAERAKANFAVGDLFKDRAP